MGAWTLPQEVLRTFCTPMRDTFTATPVDGEKITNSQVPPDSLNPDTSPAAVRLRPSTSTPAIVTAALGDELSSGDGIPDEFDPPPEPGAPDCEPPESSAGTKTHDEKSRPQQMATAQLPDTTVALRARFCFTHLR